MITKFIVSTKKQLQFRLILIEVVLIRGTGIQQNGNANHFTGHL